MIACSSASNLDCSVYSSDKQIIQSLPFRVLINPSTFASPYTSYATVNSNGRVSELSLFFVKSVPLSIFCLSGMRSLTVQYSTDFVIPPEIARVASTLLSLNIIGSSSALTLPPELFNVTSLTTLSIISCGLETLPEAIEKLYLLSNLTLTGNRLMSLPVSMSKMMSLLYLTVNSNSRLSSLDSLSGSRSLQQLNASNCAIEHLPSNMTSLIVIDMGNNNLTSLDGLDTIAWFESKSFSFNDNQITSIPVAIGKVRSLNNLDLSNNLLTELPEGLYNIKDLSTVNLRKNKFDEKETEWIQGRFRLTKATVYI